MNKFFLFQLYDIHRHASKQIVTQDAIVMCAKNRNYNLELIKDEKLFMVVSNCFMQLHLFYHSRNNSGVT